MRNVVGLFAIAVFASVAGAQSNLHTAAPRPAQDSSLAGIKSVYLNAGGNSLDSATVRDFSLELRKSGIRVVTGDQPADALMILTASKLRCGLGGCDGLFTIEVQQKVQVLRLGKPIQITTWLSDALGLGIEWDRWLPATAKQETDDFLNRWLSANGR